MDYKEKEELIKRVSKEVLEEYMRKCEDNNFIGSSAGDILYSEFPGVLSEIDGMIGELILKIRVLNKAYQAVGKYPLYHVNSDFEAIDGMIDSVYEEVLELVGSGIEVKKSFVSGNRN